jgi:hypothetical protein
MGGPLGLPADFLVAADGIIKAAHYGKHAALKKTFGIMACVFIMT